MKAKWYLALTALVFALTGAVVQAGEPVDEAVTAKLRKNMEVPGTGLVIESVNTSNLPGMYEVQFKDGPLVYATADGSYFLVGDLFTVGPKGYVNLAEKRREGERLAALAEVKPADMIVFPATSGPDGKGPAKSHITVFTDVTCFYCQKLHKEVPELNKRGIEVRYLAYPRGGIGSPGYRQLASAWCADDRQSTLTQLKSKKAVAENVCAGNPVAAQYELGQQLGVRGTPAIITASGKMIPGYQSADELIAVLEAE